MQTWKVGALARQTGLTVRTLHHYDEIGLLAPSLRTGAGHRLYTADDLGRLLQILSLRQLGLSLDEVRDRGHELFHTRTASGLAEASTSATASRPPERKRSSGSCPSGSVANFRLLPGAMCGSASSTAR